MFKVRVRCYIEYMDPHVSWLFRRIDIDFHAAESGSEFAEQNKIFLPFRSLCGWVRPPRYI